MAEELAVEAGLAGLAANLAELAELAGGVAAAMRAAGRERSRCSRGMLRRRPIWTPGLRGTWLEYKLGLGLGSGQGSGSGLGLGLGLGLVLGLGLG